MEFRRTRIPDVLVIAPEVFSDDRGFFMETFRENLFSASGAAGPFVQDNHTGSRQGVLRGLHYQIRRPQGKLVRAVAGEIFDVAADLRRHSATFGQWVGERLSGENKLQIWIPAGFAHGFYVLSAWAEVTYKVSDYYVPDDERTILWNDPTLAIEWPLKNGQPPVLSGKDRQGRRLSEAELLA